VSAALTANAKDDSGMDSLWLDAPKPAPAAELPDPAASQPKAAPAPVKEIKPPAERPVAVPAATAAELPASDAQPAAGQSKPASQPATTGAVPPNTVAAMVTLDTFKTSQLVTKGGWPGVGPFKEQASPLDMTDDNGNRLKVDVNGTQVTRAELNLQKSSGDFLDVQMNADFLLESVGVKPKKIVEFNEQLEKNRTLVTRGDGMPNMTVGRYFVAIQRSGEGAVYNISVNSLEADKTALQSHSVSEPPQQPRTTLAQLFGVGKSGSSTPPAAGVTVKVPPKKATGASTSSPASAATAAFGTSGDATKDNFANLIRNWQNLKKVAVRSKQSTDLPQVLGGRALARQSDYIRWLVNNKKYYEITPKSVIVERLTPLVPDKKYTVQTVINERSKLCEDAGTVVSDKEDTYKVNYTVEKIGDRWFIVDSALITSAPAKAQTGGKTTR
jgi:hypothetical protein